MQILKVNKFIAINIKLVEELKQIYAYVWNSFRDNGFIPYKGIQLTIIENLAYKVTMIEILLKFFLLKTLEAI